MEIEKIKWILLDFGGVLYEVDFRAMEREFKKISNSEPAQHFKELQKLILDYEASRLTSEQFRQLAKNILNISASDEEFDTAWLSILVGIYPDSVEIVEQLKRFAPLALLSNTSPIHYKWFSRQTEELFSHFEKIFLSYKIGSVKPENEIYYKVLSTLKIEPSQALFVDDSIINIQAASEIGLQTYLIDDEHRLSDLLHIFQSSVE